jgi:hypothetical protein
MFSDESRGGSSTRKKPEPLREDRWFCGTCLTDRQGSAPCGNCGSVSVYGSAQGWVISMPAGIPCNDCQSLEQPLELRELRFLLTLGKRDPKHRTFIYLCPRCVRGRKVTDIPNDHRINSKGPPISYDDNVRFITRNARRFRPPPSGFRSSPHAENAASSPLDSLSDQERKLVSRSSDLYQVLGLSFSATRVEVRAAYRQLAKVNHPDNPANEDHSGVEMMIRINHAWEVLGDPRLREAYDWLHDGKREANP